MIPHRLPEEPSDFDKEVRKWGNQWLDDHPGALPDGDNKRWTKYIKPIKDGFRSLCGYGAMWEPNGTVDHFESQHKRRDLIFEWKNYRYVSGWLNSSKKPVHDGKLLDPCEVEEGWFSIQLPSYQLLLHEGQVPAEKLERARETMRVFRLRDRENLIGLRQEWHRMYKDGELTLDGLRKKAPLLARAIEAASVVNSA